MRIGAAISVVFHIALVAVMLVFAGAQPFTPTTAEAITVDMVPEKDAPEKPKLDIPNFDFSDKKATTETQDAETKPSETKPTDKKPDDKQADTKSSEQKTADKKQPEKAKQKAAEKSAPAQQQAQQTPQSQTPPPQAQTPAPAQQAQQDTPPPNAQSSSDQQPVPQAAPIPYADLSQKFSSLTGADNSQFDAPATQAADVTIDAIGELRQRIRECSVLPKSVSRDDAIEFVLRISLRPNGTLAAEPDLFKIVKPTENGAALTVSAKKALLACQPYTMLPADKYKEWKTLDLNFRTKDFKDG